MCVCAPWPRVHNKATIKSTTDLITTVLLPTQSLYKWQLGLIDVASLPGAEEEEEKERLVHTNPATWRGGLYKWQVGLIDIG